ncbi:MAG TPA: nitroreductase family deazaflavin-dependent oxidoreductase [Jiangellaceae bacterium]|nr:nitroreductase family deazaflavin-dependent oxidoreductase [Jiangellaceae bacterium]
MRLVESIRGGTVTYHEANPIQQFLRWSAATAPVSWLYRRVLHHIDRLGYRLTRGRYTPSGWFTGLPVVILTTTGARTGQQRTSPVIGMPDAGNVVVIASNWGQRHAPAWYYNLRANPAAAVTVGGVVHRVRAREAIGDERDRLWRRDLELYPGRAAYERRAANRRIPVVVLEPVSGD